MCVLSHFSRGCLRAVRSSTRDRKRKPHDREPVAIFTGEVLPLYAADLDDDAVRILLNEFASEIGRTLEEEEVHVAYRDRTWTLRAVDD